MGTSNVPRDGRGGHDNLAYERRRQENNFTGGNDERGITIGEDHQGTKRTLNGDSDVPRTSRTSSREEGATRAEPESRSVRFQPMPPANGN